MSRYRLLVISACAWLLAYVLYPSSRQALASNTAYNFAEMLSVLPPVFVLLGLLDVWVPRETIIRLMGQKSGLSGALLSVILGATAAGPLYGAFPIAGVMSRKGASYFNILVFLGAWSTLKVPQFMFEMQALGTSFAVSRWVVNVFGIGLIAFCIQKSMSPAEIATSEQTLAQSSM
jgi:uncharacterized membrane protein YraQ (UPF0718 family)